VKEFAPVEYLHDSGVESNCCFHWAGPDPLCPTTCSDDIFLYLSDFYLSEHVHWVEFRLSKVHLVTDDVLEQYRFFLPRIESVLGNLRQLRRCMLNILSRQVHTEEHRYCFQLTIRPHIDPMSESETAALPRYFPHNVTPSSILNPHRFVQNLVGNFVG
jgi:hypothetical protein